MLPLNCLQAGINGKDLSIALEPEAASVYCMRRPVDMLAGADSFKSGSVVGPFSKGVKYMVVDIGGKFISNINIIPYFIPPHFLDGRLRFQVECPCV